MVATQPKFNVSFKEEAVLAIQRQQRGHVILILDDDTAEIDKVTYTTLGDVTKTQWTEDNYRRIQLAFMGYPTKVTIVKAETDFADVQEKLNYYDNFTLVYPEATSSQLTAMASYLNAVRGKNNYSRAVVANMTAPDKQFIINLCTPTASDKFKIVEDEETIELSAGDFTCRIAGALCGLAPSRSLTYYELPELVDAPLFDDEDAPVVAGKLIVLHQDGSFKVGRAVNSLTTLTDGITEAFQKIRIIETLDTIANDVVFTFRTGYVGKYVNNYANKLRFCLAINGYLAGLAVDGLLETANQNEVAISYEKTRAYLISKGVDVSEMTYAQILKANTGSKVLLDGVCSPTDTMEDLDLGMLLFQELSTVA